MPSCFNNFWKVEPRNSLPFSVRTQMGRRLRGFTYLSSFKNVSNASLPALTVFDFNGTICKYFEKTSITVWRYLGFSLCLAKYHTSTKSASHKSKRLETVYGFLNDHERFLASTLHLQCVCSEFWWHENEFLQRL